MACLRLPARRRSAASHAHAVDPPAVGLLDEEEKARLVRDLAGLRDASEALGDEAGDGLVLVRGKRHVEEARDLRHPHAARHRVRAVLLRDDGRLLVLVLVRDLADELLDEVLERRETRDGAVLVDDDRERLAPAAKVGQERRDRLRLRREEDLARDGARRRRRVRPAEHREDVLDVDDADGLVDRALDERAGA